ncbi:uncharacterized protein [Palaemon carinicauda]|uniref:uncharacterized protein n=1 Tax=Palaemon carinicauda TaxID=392227 RepID=UPI0035B5FFF3
MPHTVKTIRGGEKLVDDNNFVYRIDRTLESKTYWKCEIKNCKARVHTLLESEGDIAICKTVGEHSHSGNPTKPNVYSTLAKMKENATNSQLSARSLIASASASLDEAGCYLMPSNATLSRNIRKWRQFHVQVPPIPNARNGYAIPEDFTRLESGENFLLYDSGEDDVSRILIFGTDSGSDDLENHRHWACDGTFKCAPDIYYQLYTLHILIDNISIPRIFALLPNKSAETYGIFFGVLKELRSTSQLETLMTDFEKANFDSFQNYFSNVSVTGCLFHLAKNIFRKVCEFGHKVRYQSDSEFNTLVKCFTTLAFVPSSDVIRAFEELVDNDDLPQDLVSYFETYYIGGYIVFGGDVRTGNLNRGLASHDRGFTGSSGKATIVAQDRDDYQSLTEALGVNMSRRKWG